MKSIHLRPKQGLDTLTLEGPNLSWGAPGRKEWTGIERIKLALADGAMLVFDATPAPQFGEIPSPTAVPTLTVNNAGDLKAVPGQPDSREFVGSGHLVLRFHWANPLTPAGAGIWFALFIHSKYKRFELHGNDAAGGNSTNWYATRRSRVKPEWQERPFDDTLTFDQFADGEFEYYSESADDKRLPALLLGGQAEPDKWLVDLRDKDSLAFRLGPRRPRQATDPVDQALVATLAVDGKLAVPVSSRALGGDGGSVLGRGLLTVRGLRLRCARGRDAQGIVAGDEWVLDWTDVPGGPQDAAQDRLSLTTLWRHLAGHYTQGLAAVRARSRFTAVPTRIEADKPVTLRFSVRCDSNGDTAKTRLEQVGLTASSTLSAEWGGAELVDGRAPTVAFLAGNTFDYLPEPNVPPETEFRSITRAAACIHPFATGCIGFVMQDAPRPFVVDWLLGGVRTRASQLDGARLSFNLQPGVGLLERRPLTCDVEMSLAEGALSPVGQDPEPGFETLSAWLHRPGPISVDLNPGGAGKRLKLTVSETANAEQSRIVRIRARAPGQTTLRSDVAVVDPSPLTVTRVYDEIELGPDAFVAEYTDDSESAAGWEFSVGQGDMTIVLPPQSIGEEMIKGRLASRPNGAALKEVPVPGKPFQYRLGPNAHLLVDRTDIDTSRAPPPWMLRRLLARRTGVTGLKLKLATFELVYGLTTAVKTRGLRVAELDALIGRVPFADALVALVRKRRLGVDAVDAIEMAHQVYAEEQAQWILDLLNRPSWWPLFRDVGERERLALSDDVVVTVRDGRETADPFKIADFASERIRTAPPRLPVPAEPLRGGVDWLFQSPAIYQEFMNRPTSSEALVEGVAFGPLGAEGAQTASFANGKTIIISRSSQGHLESLVLMRIGRIAQYWNRARHVIVYQRSRRRAPRYEGAGGPYKYDSYDEQLGDFDGFMALRKVREYIEITEPRRPQFGNGAGPPLVGMLGQSTFETTIIPVKAAWARDIDRGQVIPLRGPLAADEERFFPWPTMFIEAARALEKGGGLIPNEAKDPRQLLFFTSTRPQDGADTDQWPAWPDLDGPLWNPPAKEEVDYKPSFRASQRQPSARRASPGRGRFTLDLIPNQEAVNLMHGRQDNAVEARLLNVSVRRALPEFTPLADALANTLGPPLAQADAYVTDKLAELREYAREHARTITAPTSPEHQQFLEDAARLIDKLQAPIVAMRDVIVSAEGKQKLADNCGDWAQRQGAALTMYVDNASAELTALAGQLASVGAELPPELEEVRGQAIAMVQAAIVQARERLDRVVFLPDQALAQLHHARDQLVRHVEAAAGAGVAILMTAVGDIERAYRENAQRAVALEREWRAAAAEAVATLRALDVRAAELVSELLGELFASLGDAKSAQTMLVTAAREVIADRLKKFETAVAKIPPFDLAMPDWNGLRTIGNMLAIADASGGWAKALVSWLDDIEKGAGASAWRDKIEAAREEIRLAGVALYDDLTKGATAVAIQAVLTDGEARLRGWAGTWPLAISNDLTAKLTALATANPHWQALYGRFDAAEEFARTADDHLTALRDALRSPDVQAVTDALEAAARELGASFNEAVKHAEHAIVEDIKAGLKDIDLIELGRPTALELTRALASGIDTDTLRCTRDALGYYYTAGQQVLDVTRSSAILNDIGAGSLNALSAMVPFDRLRERLLPQLENLDFSDLFPDLCGLKLEYLFPELKIAKDKLGEYDWLELKHDFDRDRLTAWSDVTIDKTFAGQTVLFELSPVVVAIVDARLQAHIHVELGEGGQRVQDISASIKGDWEIRLGGKAIVTIREAALVFGNDGKFDFDFEARNVVMADELKFITDAIKVLLPDEEGLTIAPLLPAGVSATLALPLPDLGTGAFTITGVTLYCNFSLQVADGFEIKVGAWLSRPDRPFGLAVLFLGGGGWAGVDVTYQPPGRFVTRVSIGISAGAFAVLNLAFCSGSAGLLFTAGVDFYQDSAKGSGSTAVSLGLLVWGEFSILCIASAYLRITAAITYRDGGMIATGRVSVSIRISFFYTLRVDRSFVRTFAGGKSKVAALAASAAKPTVRESVDLHFLTLDVAA